MFTATVDLILPSTVIGSYPRPRRFDLSMWGRPLGNCMPDIRFREKFQNARSGTNSSTLFEYFRNSMLDAKWLVH